MHKKNGLFLIILGSVFLGVGVTMGVFSVRSVTEAAAMRAWDERTAVLTRCELARHRGAKGSTTYKVIAEYKYSVGGKEYVGERVGLASGADNIGSFHQDQYRELSVAKKRG